MNFLFNNPALLYALRIILISAVLFGYYRLLLRNRSFHQFNRCFLLAIPLLSLVIPFLRLPLAGYLWPAMQDLPAQAAASAVSSGEWKETDTLMRPSAPGWSTLPSWQTLALIAYVLVVILLLYQFFRQLRYIHQLTKKYPGKRMGDIHFFGTHEPGTPFSFLKNIFWNDQLDLHSVTGKQILRHELNHVRQNHSFDLLLLKPLAAVGWFNPIFHLVYREIRAVHEFLADNDAISEGDRYQYAESLLWQTIRHPSPSLLHPFFQSPIKRRITMIIQSKTIRPTLLGRVMSLPLLFLLFSAFGNKHHPYANVRIITNDRPITVVIDAGHGGIDPGAISKNGIEEKSLNLAIAAKIKKLSTEYNIRVLMTRENDQLAGGKSTAYESLCYRADMANENKADLFIAIHTDMLASKDVRGFSIFVAKDNAHYPQCVALGTALTESLKKSYPTEAALKQRKEHIYVLDKTEMPAVLLLCGNINSEKDLAYLSKDDHQELIARNILQGIRNYAASQVSK
ncbi:N-acetylmuramoyl-L-alanine amidase [Flavitalea sp. BT771]|uniref:N-acetylmuramoyl-L-alanine amidase n=1 Tax=Flavitalea sp. BT771 TaxID=3063329 RepID=UPI0026E1A33B|nr:N-acetylmuramoyl-L-alanine amidase [Flavitalea sp. BT771]MDO6434678.1 N-acetylmuramoyl-L-alanine amidase [Flavitalea sp. BT771]MDV6223578.1 N-acetylmuramoyl-L-alanine amidase [Flavitalea sp. BT771]